MKSTKFAGIIAAASLVSTLSTSVVAEVAPETRAAPNNRVVSVINHSSLSQSLAKSANYQASPQGSYKWGNKVARTQSVQANWANPEATSAGYKWASNASTSAAASQENYAAGNSYSWGTMGLSDQAGYRWGIRNAAEQTGYRWGIRNTAEQTGYRWGIRNTAEQTGYRWGIRSTAEQTGYRWGIR